jgi:hypothetical protein
MPRVDREELTGVARLAGDDRLDEKAAGVLQRALEEYIPHRRHFVSPVTFEIDGKEPSSFYAALMDLNRPFSFVRVTRAGVVTDPAGWEFLRPFDALHVGGDGTTFLRQEGTDPLRAQSRVLLRERYTPPVPRSAGGAGAKGAKARAAPPVAVPSLATFPELATYLRATGTVPFALSLAVYFHDTRIRYDLDLVDGGLLLDARTHRLGRDTWVPRPARVGHSVDAIAARGDLTLPSARALEAVVESNGLTAEELAPVFGGVRELSATALDSLASRKLVLFDRRTLTYRPRLEVLVPPEAPRSRSSSGAPPSDPKLRASVMELIAAAESRASCPLCGNRLPVGHKGLLCASCEDLMRAPESAT